jgi:hypothetical protein
MEQHVIAETLLILETEKDMKPVAKKVSNEMNQKFGKSWICLTGINTNFSEINIDSKENTLIWVSFKDKNFLVFKPVFKHSINDPLIEARKSDAKLVIIKDGMPDMVKSLELQYKNSWYCIIGSTGNDDKLTKNLAKSAFLSFKMESLLLNIFEVKDKLRNCENKVLIEALNFESRYLGPTLNALKVRIGTQCRICVANQCIERVKTHVLPSIPNILFNLK